MMAQRTPVILIFGRLAGRQAGGGRELNLLHRNQCALTGVIAVADFQDDGLRAGADSSGNYGIDLQETEGPIDLCADIEKLRLLAPDCYGD